MKLSERPIQEIDGKSEESAALALSGHLGIFCRCSSIFLTTLSKFGQCTVTFGNRHVSMLSSSAEKNKVFRQRGKVAFIERVPQAGCQAE